MEIRKTIQSLLKTISDRLKEHIPTGDPLPQSRSEALRRLMEKTR